ncbi:MAG TPA: hypothetical protein VFF42_04545 [Candidatus Eremiobacteraceae bacterium]|nr:hypothetical protein [Candidatus Eremiobacteraceae bacterium]
MTKLGIDWRVVVGVAALIIVAAAVILQRHFKKPEDPEEEERRRRFELNQVGRIVEGLVVELVETPPSPASDPGMVSPRNVTGTGANGVRRLIRYSYSIAGVTYETAQDVTGLEERLCLERLAAGQQASVKYDPSNPSNSILVADDWSGIH